MKKMKWQRLLSALLTVCLLLTMMPVGALAANGTGHQISVKIYTVTIDDTYNLGYSTPEFVKTITVTCTDGTGHSGYNHFVELKQFHPSNLGLSTTKWAGYYFNSYFELKDSYPTIYTFKKDTVNATANVTGSEPYPCSMNMYLVYEAEKPEPPAPQAPTAPTDSEVKNLLKNKITVDCVNTEIDPQHVDKTYGLLGTYTTTTSDDGKTITVTLNNQDYCDEYNDDVATGHTLVEDQTNKTLTLTHNGTEWVAGEGVTIKVECETPEPPAPQDPTPPSVDDVMDLMGDIVVTVDCTTNEEHETATYDLLDNTITVGTVTGNETEGYTCDVTVTAADYVSSYNDEIGVEHEATDASVTLEFIDNEWTTDVETITFDVTCETESGDDGDNNDNSGNGNDDYDYDYDDGEDEDDDESLVVRIKFNGVDESLFEELPVDLLRNDKKYDTEDLSASKNSKKNWRHEWTDLDEDYDWSVQLGTVLKDYHVTVENLRGNYWVITISEIEKPNPSTGASDFAGAAVALAVVSSLGVVALSKRK